MKAVISRQAGFTLMELIVIIILLAVLSIAVFSKFDTSPFRTASFDQELRAAIRFAQKFAILSGCDVQVDISGAGYAVSVRDDAAGTLPCSGAIGGFGTSLTNPATGGAYAGAPPAGVTVGNLVFTYNGQGQPSLGGAVAVGAGTITVEPVTGFVY
ncbi:MAG TPA: prepilin-type N-terminal cleavage/methylation domain-containing protein [Gammaproteobacteria bacterium]